MNQSIQQELLGIIKTLAAEVHHDDFLTTEQITERWFEEFPESDVDQVVEALLALEDQGAIKSVPDDEGGVTGFFVLHPGS
jgi:hypothetical protein